MSNIKARLQRIERVNQASEPVRIFVHHVGKDYGVCDGKRMTLAEWDKIKGKDSTVIHVGGLDPCDI